MNKLATALIMSTLMGLEVGEHTPNRTGKIECGCGKMVSPHELFGEKHDRMCLECFVEEQEITRAANNRY
jgi:hypothetical protein